MLVILSSKLVLAINEKSALENIDLKTSGRIVSKCYPKFFNLKSAIANYYRTRRFKLDITKYLFRRNS
jgi:hypothetical protein